MTDALLEVDHVCKEFVRGGLLSRQRIRAVDDVSFSLAAGRPEIFAIIGESGSGKSTLAAMILNVLRPSSGNLRLRGTDLAEIRGRAARLAFMAQVQPIFQNPFEAFSLQLPLEEYLLRTAINLGDAATRGDPLPAVEQALADVGLSYSKVAGKGIRAFSGGELQRISVARALIAKPLLIVADEPVSMVDASLRMTIVNLFKELSNRLDVAFVYITHDLSTAYYLSDVMAIMRRGELVEFGRPETILQSPRSDYTRALLDAIPTLDRRWNI